MVRHRGAGAVAAVAVLALALPAAAGAGAESGRKAPDAPTSTGSLPSGPGPRPGPDLLYSSEPTGTQFENAGIWRAAPIRIGGASAYRSGEFVHQDFVYDESGSYPDDPALRGNAADLVEFRVKPLPQSTALRLSYSTLIDPARTATTVALGTSTVPVAVPHGAGVRVPAELFVTVHGTAADVVDAASGRTVPGAAEVVEVDLQRRQVDVRLDRSVFDPAGRSVRMTTMTGVWDPAAGTYVGGSGPRVLNASPRYDETGAWRNARQAQVLASGDLTPFAATVDFRTLAAGTDDDMTGQLGGVPQTGQMVRIYASHFESRQGRRQADDPAAPSYGQAVGGPCRGECVPDYAGRLQPYTVYVPRTAPKPEGYGLFVWLHGALGNHGQDVGPRSQARLIGERVDRPTIVLNVLGRGPNLWYYGQSGADVFEAWADLARAYPLDPMSTAMAGYSMGGYGAGKLSAQYPDLFGQAFICDALTKAPEQFAANAVSPLPVDTVTRHEPGSSVLPLLPSRRNQPVTEWAGAPNDVIPYNVQRERGVAYAQSGLDYEFLTWYGASGSHLTVCGNGTWDVLTPRLGDMRRVVDPHHVTYVRNPLMDDPEQQLVADRAYWLSDITVRDAAAERGTVDVVSHGFGLADPPPGTPQVSAGVTAGTTVPQNAYSREHRHLGPAVSAPVEDRLVVTATNVSRATVHAGRARVSCDVELAVTTDGPLTVDLAGCDRRETFLAG